MTTDEVRSKIIKLVEETLKEGVAWKEGMRYEARR